MADWASGIAVVLALVALGWGTPYYAAWRRLRHLRIEARGLVAAYGAGLIYGPWVSNRADEFPDHWRDRVVRVLLREFKREMKRQGVWEQHKIIAASFNAIIRE